MAVGDVAARQLFVDEGEVALVFLGEVELQDGVETVEEAPEVFDVVGVGTGGVDVVQHGAEAANEVGDLDVSSAHGRGRVFAAEDSGERRVQRGVFCFLVGLQLVDKKPMDLMRHGERLSRP